MPTTTLTQISIDGTVYNIGSDTVYGGLEMLDVTLPVNGWSSNAQTITISSNASVTSDFLAIPQAATAGDYGDCGVLLSSVSVNANAHQVSLTFVCSETPEVAVKAVVLVTNSAISTVGTQNGLLCDTVSLTSSGWTLSSGVYTQSKSLTWMINTDVPFCQADIASTEEAEAWSAVCKVESLNGSIKFYALDQPGENLTVQVAVWR